MSEVRVLPLPGKVVAIYDHDVSHYPDRVRIPMADGKVVTYRIDIPMSHPCFDAAMKTLENMRNRLE